MKVADLRLHYKVWNYSHTIAILDQNNNQLSVILWSRFDKLTKPQAIALAERLVKRFNDGQEGKS